MWVHMPAIINCHRLNCDVYLGDIMGTVLMCIFNVDYATRYPEAVPLASILRQ